jgi:hypothetical protein
MDKLPAVRPSAEVMPARAEIEQPLRDGHNVHAFLSGSRLRVIRIEDQAGELVGYGEAPQVEDALAHAAQDYQFGHEAYEEQYSGDNARHPHCLTGTREVSSPLDEHLLKGATFDAHQSRGGIVVTLSGIQLSPRVSSDSHEQAAPRTDATLFHSYTKTGEGQTFEAAVVEAFEAPEVELL